MSRFTLVRLSLLTSGALGMLACNGPALEVPPSVTAPSTRAAPGPTLALGSNAPVWSIQTTTRAVTGPDDCRSHSAYASIGKSGTQPVHVGNGGGLAGATVVFYYGVVTDDVSYEGVLQADGTFSAPSVPPSYTNFVGACGTGSAQTVTISATLTGRFSPDGQHFSATEVWTYQTADVVQTVTNDWDGSAP